MKLLVLDGNSIVNRAFYGIKLLTTKDGRFTNAIVGFMNILLKLEAEEKPDEVAVAFDLKAPTFRHKMYSGYKAQRKGMPEELAAQLPVLKDVLAAMKARGATYFILGCTELPILADLFQLQESCIDPTTELARAAITYCGYQVKSC